MRVECHRLFCSESEEIILAPRVSDIARSLDLPNARFDQLTPADLKRAARSSLVSSGWASNVHVPGSTLTVNFLRDEAALCLQLGNVARTYADLLKLQTMFITGRIVGGFMAVPVLTASRELGSNHAQFERLTREVELFRATVSLPLAVIGLDD